MTATDSVPRLGQAAVCEPILRALPDWFGIEAAIVQYVREIETLPTFVAEREGIPVGFLTLKRHTACAAEIYVMGVRPEARRQGFGRALVRRAEVYLRREQVDFLQVKTLSASHPDLGYTETRAFYAALGFKPLEEFKQLWNEQNPCVLMVKHFCPLPKDAGVY
jgi:ribosomal protein S18 acetylase RimI-like enzyme